MRPSTKTNQRPFPLKIAGEEERAAIPIPSAKPRQSRLRGLLEPPKRPKTRNSPSLPTTPKQRLPSPRQSAFAAQPLPPLFPHFRLPSFAEEPKNKAGFSKMDMKRILFLLFLLYVAWGLVPQMNFVKRIKAERGNAHAQWELGVMYFFGDGVPLDDVEAVKWFRKAAMQGHPYGMNGLSAMYNLGWGVPRDEVEALAWEILSRANSNFDSLPRILSDDHMDTSRMFLTEEEEKIVKARAAELHRLYGKQSER